LKDFFSSSEFRSKYELGKELGKGNFAVVKLCTEKGTGTRFAVKIMTLEDENEYEHIKEEISILRNLNHDSIIKLKEFFEKRTVRGNVRIYIVMELMEGGELFDKIVKAKSMSEKMARHVMRTLLQSIIHANGRGIVHRDLKPENILIGADLPDDSFQVKIADWGLSKAYNPDDKDGNNFFLTTCGTPAYVAPEVIEQEGYGFQCDMWSAGVIMYVMLCGFLPFQSSNRERLFRKILKGDVKMPRERWGNVSDEAKELVLLMLTVDPARRITAQAALEHRWMLSERNNSLDHSFTEYQNWSAGKKKFRCFKNTMAMLNRLEKNA